MACNDTTPWTQLDHSHTINRLRVTAGGGTSQSTGEWVKETTSSLAVCGSIGYGMEKGAVRGMIEAELVSLAGGQFKTGDQCFVCHPDCDIALNDILESYDDAAGTTKTYWRIITMLKSSVAPSQLRGYARHYWLVRMEDR